MHLRFGRIVAALLGCAGIMLSASAQAQAVDVIGRIVEAEGHLIPQCRRIALRDDATGTITYYRIPNTGSDDGILAVALTALTSGLKVRLAYDTGVTTGCGAENRVSYITLLANGG